jgi:hypothetical protein
MVETGFLEFPCTICDDLGLWQTPKGDVQPCPVIARGDRHRDPNPAALSVDRAVDELKRTQFRIDSRLFAMAKMLTGFSSAKPCERDKILVNFFDYLPMTPANQLRKFHAAIEELRRVWMLPIGSRKDSPAGYWIITDVKDFEEWINRSKSAPITQLTTIYKVAKRNFPIFAEQMELDIFNDAESNDLPSAA